MIAAVSEILNNEVEAVLKDGRLSLMLIRCYSTLYLNGGQCRVCAQSQREYYRQLQINGLEKAKHMENKTCQLPDEALHYIRGLGNKHISNANITDDEAIICLTNGWLKERHFLKLPDTWVTAPIIETVKVIEQPDEIIGQSTNEAAQKQIQIKKGRKPKTA